MTSDTDTHEIEKAGFRFDRLGFPEFTLFPLDRGKVSRNRAQAGAVCACRITRQFKKSLRVRTRTHGGGGGVEP